MIFTRHNYDNIDKLNLQSEIKMYKINKLIVLRLL